MFGPGWCTCLGSHPNSPHAEPPGFGLLQTPQLERLAGLMQKRTFAEGEVVMHEGEPVSIFSACVGLCRVMPRCLALCCATTVLCCACSCARVPPA